MAEPNPYFDGMGFAAPGGNTPHPGVLPGFILHPLGQEAKSFNPTNLVANEMVGCVSLPAVAVDVIGLVTVTNTLYGVNTGIWLTLVNGNADATAALSLEVWVANRAAGTNQFQLGYRPRGAGMGAAWFCNYLLLGKL